MGVLSVSRTGAGNLLRLSGFHGCNCLKFPTAYIPTDKSSYAACRSCAGGPGSAGGLIRPCQHHSRGDGEARDVCQFLSCRVVLVGAGGDQRARTMGSLAAERFRTNAAIPSQQTVEVPLSQLNEIQQELRYLRKRNAKRQVWEESVTKRLPQAGVDAANPPAVTPASGPQPSRGAANNAGDCNCRYRSLCCYACQCPRDPAPCLDCPHVSTLSPYFNVHVFQCAQAGHALQQCTPGWPLGVPFFLASDSLTGLNQNNVDIHARQTTFGSCL